MCPILLLYIECCLLLRRRKKKKLHQCIKKRCPIYPSKVPFYGKSQFEATKWCIVWCKDKRYESHPRYYPRNRRRGRRKIRSKRGKQEFFHAVKFCSHFGSIISLLVAPTLMHNTKISKRKGDFPRNLKGGPNA